MTPRYAWPAPGTFPLVRMPSLRLVFTAPKGGLPSTTSTARSLIFAWNAIRAPSAMCWQSHPMTGVDAPSATGPGASPRPTGMTPGSPAFWKWPELSTGSISDEDSDDRRSSGRSLALYPGTLHGSAGIWGGGCSGHPGPPAVGDTAGRGRCTGTCTTAREPLSPVLDAECLGCRGASRGLAAGAG